ncbi:hypothetical protein NDU88_011155 [Pleurodeles waltl]|uniref:Uncharacterized protein n=1 Tax=Pleurodeles waltl TaxID=8319 RepID=A0AAV7QWE8_PLEWA|nr:hypothetical protein NDU88_011155 [Pleurodeles waltl]
MQVYVSSTAHARELSRVSLSAALSPGGFAPARAPGPGPQKLLLLPDCCPVPSRLRFSWRRYASLLFQGRRGHELPGERRSDALSQSHSDGAGEGRAQPRSCPAGYPGAQRQDRNNQGQTRRTVLQRQQPGNRQTFPPR